MKKPLLLVTLSILLIAGLVFSVIQYSKTKAPIPTSYTLRQAEELQVKREHSFVVYTIPGVSESKILALKSLLETQSSVQSVQYVSADQALIKVKAGNKGGPQALQAIEELGYNPLGGRLTITITDSSQKQFLINLIRTNDLNSIVNDINNIEMNSQ
ncbi:MAG: permease-like cell division protein FtsX [bacterium]|nr:permease-like cell division protein FtsX [bacterium]